MDWIVKIFLEYSFEDYKPFHQINSIVIPSVGCLKIFVVKILQNPQNFYPSKLICYKEPNT